MIVQEDRGFEPILEHFTLHQCDFALLSHVVLNFTPLPYLSCSLLDFALPTLGSAKFRTTAQIQCEIGERQKIDSFESQVLEFDL